MKLKIPFHYRQDFLPSKRHRKTRTISLADDCIVEIAEPEEKAFPVAMVVQDYTFLYPGAKSPDEMCGGRSDYATIRTELRAWRGELYAPVRISYGSAVSTEFEGEGYIVEQLGPRNRRFPDYGHLFSEENSILVSDDKQELIQQIQENAKDYLWFDGHTWEKTAEPLYLVQTFGLGHNHGGTFGFITYYYNGNIPARNYFNALHKDEAIAYGKEVALRRGDTKSVDGMFDGLDIEVRMPEMVKADPKKEHGDGDPFLNDLEALAEKSGSAMEAGLLTIAFTAASIKQ